MPSANTKPKNPKPKKLLYLPPSHYVPGPYVPSFGPTPSRLMVIGERPGKEEYAHGRPFIGESGQVLADWFDRAEMSLDRFYLYNIVNDYKESNPEPLKWEIDRDRGDVLLAMSVCDPAVVLAVGAHSTHWFLGDDVDMETVHGVPFYWEYRNVVQDRAKRIIVVPCYHPATTLYSSGTDQMGAKGQADVATVNRVLRGVQLPATDTYAGEELYGESDGSDGFGLVPSPLHIGVDTEGSFTAPWCLSSSDAPGTADVVRAGTFALDRYRQYIYIRTAAGTIVLLHNSMHDLAVLRGLGIDLPTGTYVDTMVMAYLLCLEPKGLKALALRHCGMVMQSYPDVMADANAAHALTYILAAAEQDAIVPWPPTPEYLTYERVEGKFVPKIKRPWPIARYLKSILNDLARDKVNTKGEPVDVRARWNDIEPDIRASVENFFGPMPEATMDDLEPSVAVFYAGRDADATLRVYPVLQAQVEALDMHYGQTKFPGPGILAIDMGAIPMFERMQSNGMCVDIPHLQDLGAKMEVKMAGYREKIREITAIDGRPGAEINPNSPAQVADLLFNQLGIHSTKLTKGGKSGLNKKPSTNDKVLEAMRFVHPVLPPILDYRECSKIKSSFCDPLARLVARDGRVHTTIRTTNVASGRISSSNPNLTAQPVRSELGQELRKGFVAAPGCVIGDWDLNQIEMCEMAHQSRDPLLIELITNPERDVHSETAALTFGITLHKGNKQERYAEVDPIKHRYPAKRVGFGVITGITGKGLKAQMDIANATKNGLPLGQDGIEWTVADCDDMIAEYLGGMGKKGMCKGIYARVRTFMEECRAEARATGMVRDRWGRIRYLPGIYSSRDYVRGEAERQSHSHKISSSAQGTLKQAMAAIWDFALAEWAEPGVTHTVGHTVYRGRHVEPLIQIHDSLVWEVEDVPDTRDRWNQVMINCLCFTTTMDVPIRAKGTWSYKWGGDN